MNKIVRIIGSLVITLLIMSVPVLCTLAFVYNWGDGIKFLITIFTIIFGIILWAAIYVRADK